MDPQIVTALVTLILALAALAGAYTAYLKSKTNTKALSDQQKQLDDHEVRLTPPPSEQT